MSQTGLPANPLVCDLCGQLLSEGSRCNSGIHEGPDIPPNLRRGYPVRLSRSRFEEVTPTPGRDDKAPSFKLTGDDLRLHSRNTTLDARRTIIHLSNELRAAGMTAEADTAHELAANFSPLLQALGIPGAGKGPVFACKR